MAAKRKIHHLQIYRTAIQILFFILLPGLYASTFLGIKTLYSGIINGNLDFGANIISFIEVIAVVPITIFFGRFFCGWMCAFGAVSDWLYAISKKVFKIRFKIPEEADRVLKFIKYSYLVLLVAVLWNTDWSILEGANPWDAFGYIFSVKSLPDISGAFQYFALGTILLIIILAASMFVERFFCRYLCPLGAVFAVTSRFRILKIHKDRDKCGTCKICTNNCPMGIPMYKHDIIVAGECIQCQRCTTVCPRRNARLMTAGKKINPVLAGTVIAAAIASIYYTGNVMADRLASPSSNTSTDFSSDVSSDTSTDVSTDISTDTSADTSTDTSTDILSDNLPGDTGTTEGMYTDGIYEGSGTGFRGGTTTVSVTIENGSIASVEVLSNQDDRSYFERAESSVIPQIIETQSSEVDAVSGATFSCRGIMSAVEDALSGALK